LSAGNSCGFKGLKDAAEFKFLFFNSPKLGDKLLSRTVCVKKCPDGANENLACLPTRNVTDCSELKAYDTLTFLDGFCIPVQSDLLSNVASTFSGLNIESVAESIIANRYIFLICLGFAFAVSYLFSILLEHCTWVIVSVSIVGLLVGGTYISIMSWIRYKTLATEAETSPSKEEMMSNANFYKWVAIILWTALSIFLLVLICLFGRLVLAVNVIRAAADFVTDATGIVLVPVVVIFMSFLFFVFWCYALMRLYSTGELYHHSSYPWGKIKTSQELRYDSVTQHQALHARLRPALGSLFLARLLALHHRLRYCSLVLRPVSSAGQEPDPNQRLLAHQIPPRLDRLRVDPASHRLGPESPGAVHRRRFESPRTT